MVTQESPNAERRAPLTRERVLKAAIDLADRGGLEALSMRRLGQDLGVDAMALYRHVRDKDDLLDGVVEGVVGEIERPAPSGDWKVDLRGHVMAARRVMLRHPWAPRVLEERGTAGPAALAHINAVLGTMLDGVSPERFRRLLEGDTRSAAGATAPPQGLYLESVRY